MTDVHAESETQPECPENSAQPEVHLAPGSSHQHMIATMARLHLQNDPFAPWGGEVEPHLFRDTLLWKRLQAAPVPGPQSTREVKRVWHTVLLAVCIVGAGLVALATRRHMHAAAEVGTVERIVGNGLFVRLR